MAPVPFRSVVSACCCAGVLSGAACRGAATTRADAAGGLPATTVAPTADFELTGDGSAPPWERAAWVPLQRRGDGGPAYETRITATMTEDFLDLKPLRGVPPRPGSLWRANFYRIDHDGETAAAWHWAPVGATFHEFQRFGILRFGE